MIKPNHTCWWSSRRTTQLSYGEGIFRSSGTSLPVLFDAFRDEKLHWYTVYYGDVHFGVHDNLRLIAVDASKGPIPGAELYTEAGPLQTAIGDGTPITEYLLSKSVRDYLHLLKEDTGFDPTPESDIRYSLHTHDDCFGEVKPVDKDLLSRLVHSTLKLHSYYLEEEIDWQDTLTGIMDLLPNYEGVNLVSKFDERTLVLRHTDQLKIDTSYIGKITIAQGKATLHPGSSG